MKNEIERCLWCGCAGDDKREGIAEGLRMAAEIVQNFHKSGKAMGIEIPMFGINELILAKAKEIEEAKGEK